MKKAIIVLFSTLLIFGFAAISWADGDNTSTVFKGTGDSRSFYNYSNNYRHSFHGFESLKALEALEALDDLDDLDAELADLDLELDELENELDRLSKYRVAKNKYKYNYNKYDYDYDFDNDFDFDFDFDFDDNKRHVIHYGDFRDFGHRNNMDIDIEDDEIYITHSGRRAGEVRITENYGLYVNGKQIQTNDRQKRLLEEFYNSAIELKKYAAVIGAKGAAIGIEGAKIGLSAIGGVFKLILPGYDSDDLERDMERKTRGIEYKASLLEKEAETLEHIAYEIEDLADELKDEIPELDKLRWF